MLKDLIDWKEVLAQPRDAGGHEHIMESIFRDGEVIAEYVENDYEGEEAFAYRLADGRIVLLTDSFGSCCGCDSYEDADDDEIRQLITDLVNNAHVFGSITEAVAWTRNELPSDQAAYYHDQPLSHLLPILTNLAAPLEKGPNKVPQGKQ